MIKQALLYLLAVISLSSCRKGQVSLSTKTNEIFWLSNKGVDMPVLVKGNTASKIFVLFLHGGPGVGSQRYSGFQTNQLQNPYAVVYWDQRDAGSSAGNRNFAELSLDLMIEDLEKLITVMKFRYGSDIKIYLMGHSFGGLLGSGYLVKDNNQQNIQGWIEVDGAHDYPETNVLSRQMLIDSSITEISKGKFVAQWTEIRNYCTANLPNVSLDVSYKINVFAHDVEDYVDINHTKSPIDENAPLSFGINLYHIYYTAEGKRFLQSLEGVSFTNQLSKIKIPSCLIWGQYDFNVPKGLGESALINLGSSIKELHMMPHSGHSPFNGDTDLFAQTVTDFIERTK